jgi:alkanesulfonate monooxygenase SsuD/methylene tetrahydromethanopterin reductase-like flavin-dependent oxidoreductase (luciferase family)
MRFAIHIPIMGPDYSDARYVAALAREAEEAGWDGFFLWDHIGADWPVPIGDPWVMLAAIALSTSRIKLGPMVTPLPRRRPWKLAREAVAIDLLSNGRLILGVGIGADSAREYSCYGEPADDKLHAEMLDEGLDILLGLWSGEPFSYAGKHYRIQNARFLPKPAQPAGIPIWVAGNWPNRRPFRRAARWQGAFPLRSGQRLTEQMTVDEIRELLAYVRERRAGDKPFDIAHGGILSGDAAADAALAAAYADAGVTWWLENVNWDRGPLEAQRELIRRGPPAM